MGLHKASPRRWILLRGGSGEKSLPFPWASAVAGLKGSVLWESFSICLLTVQSLTSLRNEVACMQPWEVQRMLGQDGNLATGWVSASKYAPIYLRHFFIRPENKAVHQCISMVPSSCFSGGVRRFQSMSEMLTHLVIIRISVAFSVQWTFRPLTRGHLRMDHVWGEMWKWQPLQRR